MGPATYALCQKAVIGPAMWISGLCAFPPLIHGLEVPLGELGTVASTTFTVPVDKNYQLLLEFEFTSTEARLQDRIVGSTYVPACKDNPSSLQGRPEYGVPMPFGVVIRKAADNSIVTNSQFLTLCLHGHADNRKWRSIGWVTLARGEYIAEFSNFAVQEGLAATKTSLSLVAGGGK